ncbi:MAG: CHRD domain-containing protein [Gammaproteobacteria bacterium]|nr:CHRD domain-containing protein [Gammaproteobacteria bacterium]
MKAWGNYFVVRGLLAMVIVAASFAAGATVFRFEASLDQGQVIPAPTLVPGASGLGFLIFDDSDLSVQWLVTVAFLSTEPFAAHVHEPLGIVFSLGPLTTIPFPGKPPGTFGNYFGDGVILSEDNKDLLFDGELYFNVHTALNPAGEIRGQILFDMVVVPVPPALVMFLSGLGFVAFSQSRRA